MFQPTLCEQHYKAEMSEEKFQFLFNCICLNNKMTRQARRMLESLAPIRKIWNELILMCKDSYKPKSYVTTDEQLLTSRSRSPFIIYIPNTSSKYGMNMQCCVRLFQNT